MPLVSDQGRRKRNLIIICGFLVLLVVATAFEFGIRTPNIPVASTIVVFALFNLNLIVFLLLLVLLFRNLVKLSFERRQKVIGSKFKAKLVLAFLSLSLASAICRRARSARVRCARGSTARKSPRCARSRPGTSSRPSRPCGRPSPLGRSSAPSWSPPTSPSGSSERSAESRRRSPTTSS